MKRYCILYFLLAAIVIGSAMAYTTKLVSDTEQEARWEQEFLLCIITEHEQKAAVLKQQFTDLELESADDDYYVQAVMSAIVAVATNNIMDALPGSLLDCIDATCRVTTVGTNASRGTGVVFEIKDDTVYVITNAHVATTKKMKLEFWRDGHKLDKVDGVTTIRDRKRDVAVIELDASVFGEQLPTVIPLAARDTILEAGQEVLSVGCPRGGWAKAWSGHVLRYDGGNRVVFQPAPVGGQSGSAIFNADGSKIVALLNLMELDSRGRSTRGLAVNLQEIYNAIYGVEADEEECRYNQRARTGSFFGRSQSPCGPRECPTPQQDEPAPGPTLGGLLPDALLVLPEIVLEATEEIVPDVLAAPELEVLPNGPPPLPGVSDLEAPSDLELAWVGGSSEVTAEITPDELSGWEKFRKVFVLFFFGIAIGMIVLWLVCAIVVLRRKK